MSKRISKIALSLQASLVAAFKTRAAFCAERVTAGYPEQGQVERFTRYAKTVETANYAVAIDAVKSVVSVDQFAAIAANCDKAAKSNFVAVYAADKIIKMIQALAQRDLNGLAKIDPYTASIINNALYNNNALSRDGQLASLSRRVDLNTNEVMKSRAGVALSTALTQKSSTSELARILGLADLIKGARNQTLTLDAAKVAQLRELFKLDANEQTDEEVETE